MKPGKIYSLSFSHPSVEEVRAFLESRNDFWARESYSDSYEFVRGASAIRSQTPPSWDLFAGIEGGGLWVEVMNERGQEVLAEILRTIPEWFGDVAVKEVPEGDR